VLSLERPLAYSVKLLRALIGGLAAAALWRLTAVFMVYFFTNLSMVNVLYGSLASIIVVLLSLEIAFVILLLGAQVIADLEASVTAGLPWYEKPPTGRRAECRGS
jgi:membrane protein